MNVNPVGSPNAAVQHLMCCDEQELSEWACIYIKYLQTFRKLEVAYHQMLHPQKRMDMQRALEACMGRTLEIRHWLVLEPEGVWSLKHGHQRTVSDALCMKRRFGNLVVHRFECEFALWVTWWWRKLVAIFSKSCIIESLLLVFAATAFMEAKHCIVLVLSSNDPE